MSIQAALSSGKVVDLYSVLKGEKPEVTKDDIISGFKKNIECGIVLLTKAGKETAAKVFIEMVEGGFRAGVCYAVDTQEVSPDTTSADGVPAVVIAAKAGHTDILISLLERGANPKSADSEGNTAAHIAAEANNTDAIKSLALFKAGNEANKAGKTPTDLSPIAKDLTKTQPEGEKAEAMALKFKAQGNKVFAAGEYVKASKLYSVAIAYSLNNHVFYSNRSACLFNLKKYDLAIADATRSVAINPKWTKGFFRLGSSLSAMGLPYEAMEVCYYFNQYFYFHRRGHLIINYKTGL